MKKFAAIIICLLMASRLLAQDCTQYLYLQKNKTIEMTYYNNKNEAGFKSVSTVSDVNTIGGITTATVVSQTYDKDGKFMGTTTITYKCNGGVMMMSMNFNMPQQSKQTVSTNSTMKVEGYMDFPSSLQVGDHLKDATSKMDLGNGITFTANVTNRTVVAKESVTTPAGTWDCYKITYKTTTSTASSSAPGDTTNSPIAKLMKLGLKMHPNSNVTETTLWFAPNFGMVKSQTKSGVIEITGIK